MERRSVVCTYGHTYDRLRTYIRPADRGHRFNTRLHDDHKPSGSSDIVISECLPDTGGYCSGSAAVPSPSAHLVKTRAGYVPRPRALRAGDRLSRSFVAGQRRMSQITAVWLRQPSDFGVAGQTFLFGRSYLSFTHAPGTADAPHKALIRSRRLVAVPRNQLTSCVRRLFELLHKGLGLLDAALRCAGTQDLHEAIGTHYPASAAPV